VTRLVGRFGARARSVLWRTGVVAVAAGLATSGVAAAGVAAGTAGAATDGSTGITAKTITIGQLADVSGPIPGLFSGAQYGLEAWAAYVNSTGGIDGRKVVVDFKDSALSCTTFTNGITSLASSAFALIGTVSVVDSCGQSVLQANPNLLYAPGITTAYSLLSLPNVYPPDPDPAGGTTAGYTYIKNKFGKAAIEDAGSIYNTGAPTNAEYGRDAGQSVGWKYKYVDGIGPVQTEFTSDILRMKSDGIKVVDLADLAVNQVTDFLNQSYQQGFKPDAVLAPTAYDATFAGLLTNPQAAAPLVMPEPFPTYLGPDATAVPEVKTVIKWVHKVKPGFPLDLYTLEAWMDGLFFQSAMSHVTGTPTQQKLMAAVKEVTSFDGNGLIGTVNPAKHTPTNCAVIVGSKDGDYVRLAPASATAFDCTLGKFYEVPSS
jgi:ABC-type branched-subunit amino acid transport system substrate-binding protein